MLELIKKEDRETLNLIEETQELFNTVELSLQQRIDNAIKHSPINPTITNWKDYLFHTLDINEDIFDILYDDELKEFIAKPEDYTMYNDLPFEKEDWIHTYEKLKSFKNKRNY